jgi:hypothetical protein
MATTPTITAVVQSEVAALANKHIGLIFGLVGTIVLLMGLMGVGGYFGLKAFDAQLSRQEVRDAQYQTDRKTFLDTLTAHDAERAAQATQIAQLQAQIKARDSKPLPKPIQDGLKPGADAQTVATGLTDAYKGVPSFGAVAVVPPETIALSVPQAQQTIQSKVDLDKAQGDLGDQKSINSLLNSANSSLTNDLGSCKTLNVQANKDIAGFKKLAVRSKWQRFLAGAEKVGLLAGGAMLGHMI